MSFLTILLMRTSECLRYLKIERTVIALLLIVGVVNGAMVVTVTAELTSAAVCLSSGGGELDRRTGGHDIPAEGEQGRAGVKVLQPRGDAGCRCRYCIYLVAPR